jgi:hypothetical protein
MAYAASSTVSVPAAPVEKISAVVRFGLFRATSGLVRGMDCRSRYSGANVRRVIQDAFNPS